MQLISREAWQQMQIADGVHQQLRETDAALPYSQQIMYCTVNIVKINVPQMGGGQKVKEYNFYIYVIVKQKCIK